MSTLVQSDIFFFMASIGFSIVTILLCVILVYGILIAKKVLEITKMVKATTEDVVQAIHDVQNYIEESPVLHFMQTLLGRSKKREDIQQSSHSKKTK